MIREIAWVLIACAATCALLLVALLGWHELSGKARRERYRAAVSANRLAIRQEATEVGRQRRPVPRTTAGEVVAELTLDTSNFNEQMRKVQQQCEQADAAVRALRAALLGRP